MKRISTLLKISLLFGLALLVLPGLSCSNSNSQSSTTLNWHPDVYSAFKQAAAEGKNVFLYLEADWCGYCRKLEDETFTDPRVIDEAGEAFIWVKLDGDTDPDGQRFKDKFNVRGYPALILLDSNEEELDRIAGYVPPDRFLELVTGMREGETFANLRQRVQENPEDLESTRKLAEKLLFRGQTKDSLQNLERIVKSDPANEQGQMEPALYLMAQAAYAMGQYQPTLDILDKYDEKFPEGKHRADFMLLRAQMNLENNDTDLAFNTLQKFLEEYPEHPKAELVKKHMQ